ncbi:Ancient ubiquitous protein 1 [Mactra antiquata]
MVELKELLIETRFPPGYKFALMILYFPIGVFLIVCRVLIALHTYMIVCLLPRTAARRQFVRGMLGVLGIHIWVDEDTSPQTKTPKLLMSNYTSILDHVVLDVVVSHFVPYHGNVPTVFQWVLGYRDLTTDTNKQQFLENIKKFVQEQDYPVLIQPEGVPTNNNVGLLKFNTQAFELELPVQPMSIHMSRLSFPCALTTIDGPKWTDVLWCFFTPVTVFKLKTHPVTWKQDNESTEDFTERVRDIISSSLNLEKTDYTAADVGEYRKKIKTPHPPPKPPGTVQSTQSYNTISSGSNFCLDNIDIELKKMIQQVKDVLPEVPITVVKQDLELTKDVDATISNILDGRVVYKIEETESQHESTTPKTSPDKDMTLFKASSFPRSPKDRHLSLEERKTLMLDTARLKYKQKHGLI